MTTATASPTHRRIAVFGSVAAQGAGDSDPVLALSPSSRAVLQQVLAAIAADAPSIARPILDRAVAQGEISRAERHSTLVALRTTADVGESDDATASQDGRLARREALAAIRRAAPGIARPILDEAVEDERLTPAQERRILDRLRTSPTRVLRTVAT
jgi:hypothetical protein